MTFGVRAISLPALLVLLELAKGLCWATLLPPWYGPDEPAHFIYAETLLYEHRLPMYAAARSDGTDIPPDVACSERDMGWRPDGPFMEGPYPLAQDHALCAIEESRVREPAVPSNPAAGYSPLYYALAIPVLAIVNGAPVEIRLFSVRLLSVLLGAGATLMVYLASLWALGHRRSLAGAAAAVYAFQPMLSQQYALVNNDVLLDFLAAAFFWRLVRSFAIVPGLRETSLLAGIVGLAYLAKPQGILLALLLPGPALAALRAGRLSWRSLFGQALVAAAVLTALAAGGLIFEFLSQGSPVPQDKTAVARDSFRHYLDLNLGGHGTHLWWLWVATVWGDFGWLTVALPRHLYEAIVGVLLIALLGSGWAALRRHAAPALALLAVLLLCVPLQAWEAQFFREHAQLVLQGRNFFFAFPAAVIFIVGGVAGIAPRGCEHRLALLLAVASAALNAFSVLVVLEAFYG